MTWDQWWAEYGEWVGMFAFLIFLAAAVKIMDLLD